MLKPGDLGGSLDEADLPVYIEVGQPRAAGAVARGHLVRAGRRAQAVARRGRDRARRHQQEHAVRAAGPGRAHDRAVEHRTGPRRPPPAAVPARARTCRRPSRCPRRPSRGPAPATASRRHAPGARPRPVSAGEARRPGARTGRRAPTLARPAVMRPAAGDRPVARLPARAPRACSRRASGRRRRAGGPRTRTRTTASAACTSPTTRWTTLLAGPRRPRRSRPRPRRPRDAQLAALEAGPPRPRPRVRGSALRALARCVRARRPSTSTLLLVALAPDLDPRFERLYGYLHDDVSRRRASVGLALELCAGRPGAAADGAGARPARAPRAARGRRACCWSRTPDRPMLTRSLRVPDRVTAHLLGDDSPGPASRRCSLAASVDGRPRRGGLARARARGRAAARLPARAARLRLGQVARVDARSAAARPSRRSHWTSTGSAAADDPAAIALAASREARLRGAGLVARPGRGAGRARRGGRPGVRRAAAVRSCSWAGAAGTRPGPASRRCSWTRPCPTVARAPRPVGRDRSTVTRPPGFDPAVATIAFRLAPEQIDRAARAARATATAAGRPMTVEDVAVGARAQNAAGLERLARRIVPSVGWDGPRAAAGRRAAAARAHRARPPPRPGRGGVADGRQGRARPRDHRAVRRRLRHRQDDVGRGAGGRPRLRRLRHRPVDGRRQVHRRDREEPGPDLHRGGPGQRRPAVRRGRRAVRQALRGQGRPRPVRQRRGRLPAPAHGALRRAGDPDHEPARQRGRGVRAAARRDRRLPDARGGAPPAPVAAQPAAARCPSRATSTSTSWPASSRSRAATSATCASPRPTSPPPRTGP